MYHELNVAVMTYINAGVCGKCGCENTSNLGTCISGCHGTWSFVGLFNVLTIECELQLDSPWIKISLIFVEQ